MHEVPQSPTPKKDVIGPNLIRKYNFNKVKRHHTEGCYQIKREIEHLIQEGHLKKYANGVFAQSPGEPNSQGRDDYGIPLSKKGENQEGVRK